MKKQVKKLSPDGLHCEVCGKAHSTDVKLVNKYPDKFCKGCLVEVDE